MKLSDHDKQLLEAMNDGEWRNQRQYTPAARRW